LKTIKKSLQTYAKLLGDAVQEETGHPEVIANGDSHAGSHLELPLSGHHLGIGSGHLDSGIQTGTVVGIHNVAGVDLKK